MNVHYVCPACGGVADHAKQCETDGCPLHSQPLKECHCADGAHAEVRQSGSGVSQLEPNQ